MLFGSRPPPNDSLWKIAKSAGFEVVVEDRNVANKEKKIDTGIVTAMMRDAYKCADKDNDTITLVSGDKDFVPPIRELVKDGFNVEVVFFGDTRRMNLWTRAANLLNSTVFLIISHIEPLTRKLLV